ncbi:MAG: hypothetical protein L0287_29595 [Anaerolineae bacterium]|nr:hypothetical protein [Anaerolineae bacterium]
MVISKSPLRIILAVLFVVILLTQACLARDSSRATALPTITNTFNPEKTQTTDVIELLITTPRLRFDSWSPDSQWIAYWFSDSDDAPVNLAFADVSSGEICQHNEISADDIESGNVRWLENGNAIVFQDPRGDVLGGVPCGVFSSVENATTLKKEIEHVSPDGRYRADTSISGWEGELMHNITTITEISTNQIAVSVKWDGSPHVWAESGWLNNELYLVGLDVNSGALYVSAPDNKVGNVVSDFLGIKDIGYISHIGRHAETTTGEYHLLIELWNGPPGSPLLLYHSELDLVEELPFYRSWIVNGSSISPDGEWLFISYPSLKTNDETTDFWIRSVDPPDSVALQLAEGMGFVGFSNEAQKIAFTDNTYVYILNFPNGELLSQWGASGYEIDRVWWSPDGSRLVMQGFPTGSQPEALFVVEP